MEAIPTSLYYYECHKTYVAHVFVYNILPIFLVKAFLIEIHALFVALIQKP
jgi:hypothetical protein